ncbi:MAG TPA: hypothetical protein VES36_06530, partial [Candidatus Limnocylindrales bacterium]|nr:hypothetical protein [Candidatus Limnocylindrales bacterium]
DEYGKEAIALLAEAYRGGASDEKALETGTGVAAEQLFADFYSAFGVDAPRPVVPAKILPSNVRKPGGPGATEGDGTSTVAGAPATDEPGNLAWVVPVALVLVVVVGTATWAARRRVSRREPT